MRNRHALLATIVAIGLAYLLAAATAAAGELEFPTARRGFTFTWSRFEFDVGGRTVTCALTLEGTLVGGTFATVARTPVGSVTAARISSCRGGTAVVRSESLPWQLQYSSFAGTLPHVTEVTVRMISAVFQIEPSEVPTQIVRTSDSSPAILHVSVRDTHVTGVEADARTAITSDRSCVNGVTVHLLGRTASQTVAGGSEDIRLVQAPVWIVSVGDSYISGEAGRWAGNVLFLEAGTIATMDKLGGTAYDQEAERIEGCHRSASAEILFGEGAGGGPRGKNLACSGARVATTVEPYVPGLDFPGEELDSQATLLKQFAEEHTVTMVVVSIGGNEFEFARIIRNCVTAYITFRTCNGEALATEQMGEAHMAIARALLVTGLENVHRAMAEAGYANAAYTIVVQNYESPVPSGGEFRYAEYEGEGHRGVCTIRDADATWANTTALPTINATVWEAVAGVEFENVETLDLSTAFEGRRVCEEGVGTREEKGLEGGFEAPREVAELEWVNRILAAVAPTMVQEGLHPNYWGQMALRNCLRQAYNVGNPKSGTCTREEGLENGEPRMRFE